MPPTPPVPNPSAAAPGAAPGPAAGASPPPLPSPEEVASRIDAQLPEPTSGFYRAALVQKIGDAAVAGLKAVLGKHAPPGGIPDQTLDKKNVKGGKWMGRLPLNMMVPALLFIDLVVSLGGPDAERYAVDVDDLATDDGLEMLLAKMRTAASDKKIRRVIDDAMAPPKEEKKSTMKAEPRAMPEGAAAFV